MSVVFYVIDINYLERNDDSCVYIIIKRSFIRLQALCVTEKGGSFFFPGGV